MIFDRICAIATPTSISAIGMIRCSGEGSVDLARKLMPGVKTPDPRRVHLTKFVVAGEVLDEVVTVFYSAPS